MVGRIVGGTPPYVWVVLALLLFLGARRLRPRRVHIAVAAIAPVGFGLWTAFTLARLATANNGIIVATVPVLALFAGYASGPFRLVDRPVHRGGGRFDFAGTAWPLILFLGLFAVRYALEVGASMNPSDASSLRLIGAGITAFATGRMIADLLPLARIAIADRGRAVA